MSGTYNVVDVDSVGHIKLSGIGNKVSYGSGPGGQAPSVERSGMNNAVTSR
jgi:hypothetical protein